MEPEIGRMFPPTAQISLAEEGVTAYGWKALAGSVTGFCMDGFDMLILSFMLGAITADLALTSVQAGSLVTWTMLGAVAGGLIFGTLSDHFGRIRVLTWTILVFAVFTGLCALAQGYWDLVAYRAVAGLGLGGEFGIGMALAAEAWPASKRARVSSYVAVGWHGGVLLAAFATPLLLPVIGWRIMFLVGVLPALGAFIVRRTIHEPEIFLRKHATRNENSFRSLVKDTKTFRATLGIAILCSVQNFAYYGIMIWMPSYLEKSLGFSLIRSSMWTAMTVLGMVCGIWVCGQLADRIGRKPIFILFQIGAVIMVFVYSRTTDPRMLFLGGSDHGHVCERNARRHWRTYFRGVSHGSPRNRAEHFVELWSRSRFAGTAGGWRLSREVFISRRNQPPRIDLLSGYDRDTFLDPRAQGQSARVDQTRTAEWRLLPQS